MVHHDLNGVFIFGTFQELLVLSLSPLSLIVLCRTPEFMISTMGLGMAGILTHL